MSRHRTVTSVHNDWLTLVEPVGAFLTIPVLKRVFPNGIPPVDRDARADVRQRLEELGSDVASRTAWLRFLFRELLGHGMRFREGAGIPGTPRHTVAERHITLQPDFAIVEPQENASDRIRLLGVRWPHRSALDKRPTSDEHGRPTDWAATPIERAAMLCRAVNVPLALVTDAERFALVWAPRTGPSGHAIWTSSLFGEERLLLDSFAALLGAQRFFGVADDETLEALLTESGAAQAEVTGRLGEQVRRAVELLVGAFSRADRASGGRLLTGVSPAAVYNASVTVMMRLVVLLAAEERRLLPADDPLYSTSYSVLTIREELERAAMRDGIETLEKRHAAWHRLLATFRAVHGGIEHDRLRLPPYGGSLFDPARYPFLDSPPIPVDDRSILAVLDALQVLSFRQGGITEARRLSYLNLDVEQIGHVYEGLLDHGCARVQGVSLGLLGRKGEEPEIALTDLERELGKGDDAFAEWVAEHGGPPASRTKKLLYEELDPDRAHRLLAACDNDESVYAGVRKFSGLLRDDLRGLPTVFMPGSLYVTQTSLRRDSGTAYTTKELADEVVRYALEPLVYQPGAAEGAKPEDWKLKSSADILRLKVCDPAVGSGAILVAACRFLADRLVEAWQAEAASGTTPAILEGVPPGEWTLIARRAVTDHCLYGVDRNPMALEMAKLSLWLTTMAKQRPFTFLDHQVRVGDSLLGITSLDQIRWFHINPEEGRAFWERQLFDPTAVINARVSAALEATNELGAIDVVTLEDVERKARLHARAVDALRPLEVLADGVVGAALAAAGGEGKLNTLLASVADPVRHAFDDAQPAEPRELALAEIEKKAAFWLDTGRPEFSLDRQCLHWPLVFPEAFLATGRSGFDAIIGNPPFLGGKRISGALGSAYREYLVEHMANGVKGNADLVAYFFLRAFDLLKLPGMFGLLATNTIAQGETREVGLDQLAERGATFTRAVPSEPWPGTTSLDIAKVWSWKGEWSGSIVLGDATVRSISAMLTVVGRVKGQPKRLAANRQKSFIGSYVLGLGFVLTADEAASLIAKEGRNRDVVWPYLNGDDINSRPDQSPSRWVINFFDWPLSRTAPGHWASADEAQRREWLKCGHVPIDYPGPVATDYPDCLAIVESKVKPERTRRKPDGSFVLRYPLYERWWQYADKRPGLYRALQNRTTTVVKTQVSPTWAFAVSGSQMVFDQKVVVLCDGPFEILQSSIHWAWAVEYGSTLGATTYNYNPTDCYETFPFSIARLASSIAQEYYELRQQAMAARNEGLTRVYNRFHSINERANDIDRLRQRQVALDLAVAEAYGWTDVPLGHDFHETKQGIRFTMSPVARQEVLDRLLELNHQRYREEVEQGLHEEASGKTKRPARKGKEANRSSPLLEEA